jgi:hypothetical protein
MKSFVECWVQTCRCDLLDRTLIWNLRHLLHALREYEIFNNEHWPHQSIADARHLKPLTESITDPDQLTQLNVRRRDRLGGVLHEYTMLPELPGRHFQQAQPYSHFISYLRREPPWTGTSRAEHCWADCRTIAVAVPSAVRRRLRPVKFPSLCTRGAMTPLSGMAGRAGFRHSECARQGRERCRRPSRGLLYRSRPAIC